jgi:hypothetical protein
MERPGGFFSRAQQHLATGMLQDPKSKQQPNRDRRHYNECIDAMPTREPEG